MMKLGQRADLTYKDNRNRDRHGWVRLTPAYSVKLVETILNQNPAAQWILEPFSGTGTTGLVAGERGLNCDLFDINPFLLWLAKVKCANYNPLTIKTAREAADVVVDQSRRNKSYPEQVLWTPPISHIERWWSAEHLAVLAQLYQQINTLLPEPCQEKDLLLVAFCRLMMQWSNAAFNHQSMSFKESHVQLRMFDQDEDLYAMFLSDLIEILSQASCEISGVVNIQHTNSRAIPAQDIAQRFDLVITSPPYVNRMSYIRELRPYMYWLGYLKDAREAGDLDWEAVGGTWGTATSRLMDWEPPIGVEMPPQLEPIVRNIARSSAVLSRYVHKYFVDMSAHFASVFDVVRPGGRMYYIIGNSKFYDTLVPAEALYADLLKHHGFIDTRIEVIRKRNSKKELFEYLVSATRP